jgi:hypothetical protein
MMRRRSRPGGSDLPLPGKSTCTRAAARRAEESVKVVGISRVLIRGGSESGVGGCGRGTRPNGTLMV